MHGVPSGLYIVMNKAEHAVQSYAAGVGGLGAWGLGLYLQYADHMAELQAHIGVNDGRKRIN